MKRSRKLEILQTISCFLCVVVAWLHLDTLGASEFIGGKLTGPLFEMVVNGIVLFLLAILLMPFYRRTTTAMALTASLLCMPFYLYFLAPGPFRRVFRGEYSVPLVAPFVWSSWAFIGILSLAFAILVSVRCLAMTDSESGPEPNTGVTS